jgi:Tfp pilus assembly protein PilF
MADRALDCNVAISIDQLSHEVVLAYITRAGAYLNKFQYDQVIRDCSKAIEIMPDISGAYLLRVTAWTELKQYDKAWADVKTCRQQGVNLSKEELKKLIDASGRSE